MNTEQLREYLGIALDMEKNIYMQRELRKRLEMEANRLGKPLQLVPPNELESMRALPSRRDVPVFQVPQRDAQLIDGAESKRKWAPVMLIVSIAVFLLSVVAMASGFSNVDDGDYYALGMLGVCGAVPLFIVGLCNTVRAFRWPKVAEERYKEEYRAAQQRYQNELAAYNSSEMAYKEAYNAAQRDFLNKRQAYERAKEDDDLRVIAENQEKEVILANIRIVDGHLEKSILELGRMYAHDIVYPKYRNLSMISSLYEYISAGICDKLEGHEGAYNKLDGEILMNRIVDRLDTVNSNLTQIMRNQFKLYEAIQTSNAKLDMLRQSVNGIGMAAGAMAKEMGKQNILLGKQAELMYDQKVVIERKLAELQATSELNTYYSERAAKELEHKNRMDDLMGRNMGPYF